MIARLVILLAFVVVGCKPNDSGQPKIGRDLAGTYRLRFDARVGQWFAKTRLAGSRYHQT